MLEAFEQFIQNKSLFSKKDSLLLAISGGKDSVALFHLLLKAGYSFEAAHCNFRLRGSESNDDQAFVQDLCHQHQITCHVKLFDTESACRNLGKGIQETARILRYEWFNELLLEHQLDYLLTAHHADDHLETILIQLMRQSGIAGLHGIKAKKEHLVRPLLFATVNEINAYLDEHNIAFRTDSSNSKDDYLRNAIRHTITPAIASVDPEFTHKMIGFSERVLAYEALFNDLLKAKQGELIDGKIHFSDDLFKGIQEQPLLLYYLLEPYGFKFKALPTFDLVENVPIGSTFLHHDWTLTKDRGAWVLCQNKQTIHEPIHIHALPFNTELNTQTCKMEAIAAKTLQTFESNALYLDADNLHWPLNLRLWQAGDKMHLLGMTGHKLISDVLTDKKVAHTARANQYVLTDSFGTILALLGHCSSEAYRVKTSTEKIIQICLK